MKPPRKPPQGGAARRWVVEAVRALLPPGLALMPRAEADPQVIVESWA